MNGNIVYEIFIWIAITVLVNIMVDKLRKIICEFREQRRGDNSHRRHRYRGESSLPPEIPVRRNVLTGNTDASSGSTFRRNTGNIGNQSTPPPLPQRRRAVYRQLRSPDSFPKCPVCRVRNREGQNQMVFKELDSGGWKCINGHIFQS